MLWTGLIFCSGERAETDSSGQIGGRHFAISRRMKQRSNLNAGEAFVCCCRPRSRSSPLQRQEAQILCPLPKTVGKKRSSAPRRCNNGATASCGSEGQVAPARAMHDDSLTGAVVAVIPLGRPESGGSAVGRQCCCLSSREEGAVAVFCPRQCASLSTSGQC